MYRGDAPVAYVREHVEDAVADADDLYGVTHHDLLKSSTADDFPRIYRELEERGSIQPLPPEKQPPYSLADQLRMSAEYGPSLREMIRKLFR